MPESISNIDQRRKVVSDLNEELTARKIQVKRQKLLDLFAKAQGFKNDYHLINALPIDVDISPVSAKIFTKALLETSESPIPPALAQTIDTAFLILGGKHQGFPVLAGYMQVIAFDIDWRKGLITRPPFPVHESDQGCPENLERFKIGSRVTEQDFTALEHELAPLLKVVKDGISLLDGTYLKYSAQAQEAQEEARFIIENTLHIFQDSVSEDLIDFFGEDFPSKDEVCDEQLTEITHNGITLLNHSTPDYEVGNVVRKFRDNEMISDNQLFDELIEYRDICRANYSSRQ